MFSSGQKGRLMMMIDEFTFRNSNPRVRYVNNDRLRRLRFLAD